MPTSNSKPRPSFATDSPLGAPAGNEPYKTIRAKNWAQEDGKSDGVNGTSIYETDTAGNASAKGDGTAPAPKPAQGA